MEDTCLYPVFVRQGTSQQAAKVGYINRAGLVVIDPTFDDGTYFYDGIAAIRIKNKWGFIDSTGAIRIAPRLPNPGYFDSGVASVSIGGGYDYGVVDVSGRFVVPPKRQEIGRFSEGMAWFSPGVPEKHQNYGFLNQKGEVTVAPTFSRAASFSEGLAAVELNRKWGFIEESGAFCLEPTYLGVYNDRGNEVVAGASSFRQGLARVHVGNQYAYIDKKGKVQFQVEADLVLPFAGDRALIRSHGNFGFIDNMGNVKIDIQFSMAYDFSDAMSAVEVAKGSKKLWGIIDRNGKWLVEPRFLYALPPRSGLCFVETEETIGYVNATGEFVWEAPFVEYRAFGL
ncbi:MAG TPA: WG repeat-containing protein [Candidatus Acidoferrum sp.]